MLRILWVGSLCIAACAFMPLFAGTASAALPSLEWLSSTDMPLGTHRPELLVTSEGGLVVIVVEHDGNVRHNAYRYDSDLNPIGSPFVVTEFTETHGWPADHRAVMVGDEILVTYQTLLDTDTDPCESIPEHCADFQSFMLARFELDGTEILRTPIVENATDFTEDNFPDHCILWRGDHLLASTGSLGNQTLKFREVDLDGTVQSTVQLSTSPTTIPSAIGNSLAASGDDLLILSYRLGPGLGRLAVTQLGGGYTPGTATTFSDAGSIHKFPTGNLWEEPFLFVAYTKHDDTLADTDPYFPYIRTLDSNFQDIDDFRVGEGDGFAGVHPTMVRSGDKVYVAWSRVGAQTGSLTTPQVRLEVYAFDSGVSAVPGAVPWVRVTLAGVLLGFGFHWLRSVRGAVAV